MNLGGLDVIPGDLLVRSLHRATWRGEQVRVLECRQSCESPAELRACLAVPGGGLTQITIPSFVVCANTYVEYYSDCSSPHVASPGTRNFGGKAKKGS